MHITKAFNRALSNDRGWEFDIDDTNNLFLHNTKTKTSKQLTEDEKMYAHLAGIKEQIYKEYLYLHSLYI